MPPAEYRVTAFNEKDGKRINEKTLESGVIQTNQECPAQDLLVNSLRLWGFRIGFVHNMKSPLKAVIIRNLDTGQGIPVLPGGSELVSFEKETRGIKETRVLRVVHEPEEAKSL